MLVLYNSGVLEDFETEKCIWIFLFDFGTLVPKYVLKNVWNNLALIIVQNIYRPKRFNSVCK